MGLRPLTAYAMECDGCGKELEGGEYTIWVEPSGATETAQDIDWTTDGEKWHCAACPTLTRCACCGQPAGEYPGERDDHCQSCWNSIEAGSTSEGDDGCTLAHPEVSVLVCHVPWYLLMKWGAMPEAQRPRLSYRDNAQAVMVAPQLAVTYSLPFKVVPEKVNA